MTDWFYRATSTKVPFEETRALAAEEGFICRSAFEQNGSRADNTQHVAFRDVIHMYFVDEKGARTIGSFEVVGPNRHPHAARFGDGVKRSALFQTKDEAFAQRLGSLGVAGSEGYQPDPVLKTFVGWAVVPKPDVTTPPYDGDIFPNQATLVRAPR